MLSNYYILFIVYKETCETAQGDNNIQWVSHTDEQWQAASDQTHSNISFSSNQHYQHPNIKDMARRPLIMTQLEGE